MTYGSVFSGYHSVGGGDSVGAKAAARGAQSSVNEVKMDIERLLMITEALWTMIQEEHNYSDEDLIKKIAEIDLRDGRLDGRVAPSAPSGKCVKCNRTLSKKRPTCLYCGAAVVKDPFER